MATEWYKDFAFKPDTLHLIAVMNAIIEEYQADGYTLTVRQLYYQLVARDHIPNTQQSYKRTTSIVNDARLAGMMDWDAIEDRTREFITISSWTGGASILQSAADSFHMDMWDTQPVRVFCIVEKEALAGVLERVCKRYDIPLLAARGYPSGTVLREFAEQMLIPAMQTQEIVILHLGDHDPSGIDMTRDLDERISLFAHAGLFTLKRIALNMDQIEDQQPPPNPAKVTDSRFADYESKYGEESWELDALKPDYLAGLVRAEVEDVVDQDAWDERKEEIQSIKDRISEVAESF